MTTGGFTNRLLTISSEDALTLDVVCYESCSACVIDNIAEANAIAFNVFPSVTDGNLTIAFPAPLLGAAQIELRDLSGRLVKNTNLSAGMTQLQLDLSSETDGFYVVRRDHRFTNRHQGGCEATLKQNDTTP